MLLGTFHREKYTEKLGGCQVLHITILVDNKETILAVVPCDTALKTAMPGEIFCYTSIHERFRILESQVRKAFELHVLFIPIRIQDTKSSECVVSHYLFNARAVMSKPMNVTQVDTAIMQPLLPAATRFGTPVRRKVQQRTPSVMQGR